MKYLIAGLGNIGAKYAETRHNAGFEVVDTLAREFEVEWNTEKLGDLAEFRYKGRVFILLKPSTYMNLSGKSVRYWMQQTKVPQDKLLVIVDDISLPFGKLRLRGKGSDAGHNGLRDINQTLGHQKYPRLRFGIGDDFPPGRQVDYVLGRWSKAEKDELPARLEKAAEAVKLFATLGLARAMNIVNSDS